MRLIRTAFAGFVPSIVVVIAATSPVLAQDSDSEDVMEAVDGYHTALAAGDAEGALGMLAEDAIILESGGQETREEYASGHLRGDIAFAAAVPRERGPIQVTVLGDVAWAVSTSTTQGEYRDREINSRGAELMVLVRTGEGWRIAAVHWSSRAARN